MAKTMTVAVRKRISLGGTAYGYIGTFTPDTSYETGGDTLVEPTSGPTLPEKIDYMGLQGSGGIVPQWDGVNQKVKLYESNASGSALKEVAAAANQSANAVTFFCIGA